jgi:hypothetical protein
MRDVNVAVKWSTANLQELPPRAERGLNVNVAVKWSNANLQELLPRIASSSNANMPELPLTAAIPLLRMRWGMMNQGGRMKLTTRLVGETSITMVKGLLEKKHVREAIHMIYADG